MPWAADYWDAWEHLVVPQPSDLLDYRLANGLSVRCTEPNRVWDVDYADPAAGLELHFRCTALMDPYDINDPDVDPMAARVDRDKTWGHAYAGHFDLSGHFEGELVLRGTRTPIDCVSTMDHSWGVRAERQTSRLSWQHAHVSPDLAIHVRHHVPAAHRGHRGLRIEHEAAQLPVGVTAEVQPGDGLLTGVAPFRIRHAADLVESDFLRDRLLVHLGTETRPPGQHAEQLEGRRPRGDRASDPQPVCQERRDRGGSGDLENKRRPVAGPRGLHAVRTALA